MPWRTTSCSAATRSGSARGVGLRRRRRSRRPAAGIRLGRHRLAQPLQVGLGGQAAGRGHAVGGRRRVCGSGAGGAAGSAADPAVPAGRQRRRIAGCGAGAGADAGGPAVRVRLRDGAHPARHARAGCGMAGVGGSTSGRSAGAGGAAARRRTPSLPGHRHGHASRRNRRGGARQAPPGAPAAARRRRDVRRERLPPAGVTGSGAGTQSASSASARIRGTRAHAV